MDIQVVSDLHLESPKAYDVYQIKPNALYLALLGDIGCVSDPGYLAFLATQLSQFRVVFHLLGNHEPYGSTWPAVLATLREFQQDNRRQRAAAPTSASPREQPQTTSVVGEYVLLDRDEFHPPGNSNLVVLGCTLFSHVAPPSLQDASLGLNDFCRIGDWTVEQHVEAHARDLAWLNERVAAIARESPGCRIVIFTHHSPTIDERTVNPRFAASKIASGFATDLGREVCWMSRNLALWAFGHTHYNFDRFWDENTGRMIYSNQRGYYFAQASGFDDQGVVHIN